MDGFFITKLICYYANKSIFHHFNKLTFEEKSYSSSPDEDPFRDFSEVLLSVALFL